MGPDRIRPDVLKKLAVWFFVFFPNLFEMSWRLGEVPYDWRKTNVTPSFQKGKKDDLRTGRSASLQFLRNSE